MQRKGYNTNHRRRLLHSLCFSGSGEPLEIESSCGGRDFDPAQPQNDPSKQSSSSRLRKSKIIYNIPYVVAYILLFGLFFNIVFSNNTCYAESTATLTLGDSILSTNATMGDTAYVSSTIKAEATNVTDYTLSIIGPVGLEGNSTHNSTTIIGAGGNTPANMPNNSWGYYYDTTGTNTNLANSDKTYESFTGTTQTLESGTTPSGIAKNITFAAKFDNTAEAGHYTAKVTVNLVATPAKVAEIGEWTLPDGTIKPSGITTMQEMTPSICEQVSIPIASEVISSGKAPIMQLRDTRDESVYSIARYPNGRCWMTQNLKIMNKTISPSNSSVSSDYSIPASNVSNFTTSDTAQAAHLGADSNGVVTGYYTWCAATAGTCSSATGQGAHASSSICPKGWRLPGGYSDVVYGNEFRTLFLNMGLTISNNDLADSRGSYTNWGTNDLAHTQSSPYNFNYTGTTFNGSYNAPTSDPFGLWWSSTAYSGTSAYSMYISSSFGVFPGNNSSAPYNGFAIRCIASTDNIYSVTYALTEGDTLAGSTWPETQTATTANKSQSFTVESLSSLIARSSLGFGCTLKNWKGSDGKFYEPGATITLTSSNPSITLSTGEISKCNVYT